MRGALVLHLSGGSVACAFAGRMAVDAGCEVVHLAPPEGNPLRQTQGALAGWLLDGQRVLSRDDAQVPDLLRRCDAVLADEAGRDWLAAQAAAHGQAKVVLVGERDAATLAGIPADRGDEFLAFHGSGLGHLTPRVMPGYPSAGPLCPQAHLLEFLAGLYGAIALFALIGIGRDSDAHGATVGFCGAALPLLRREIAAVLLEGAKPHRAERIWKVSPAEVHRCRDGWVFVDVIEDRQWTRLCEWMGRPELATDARYTSRDLRFDNAQALCEVLDAFFADRPQACWLEAQRQGVPVAPVNDLQDLRQDPQLQARGFWDALGRPLTPLARLFAREAA